MELSKSKTLLFDQKIIDFDGTDERMFLKEDKTIKDSQSSN